MFLLGSGAAAAMRPLSRRRRMLSDTKGARLSAAIVGEVEVWVARAAVAGLLAVFVWSIVTGAGAEAAWAQAPTGADLAGSVVEIMPDEPCFLNSTAPHRVLQNCDARGDWLGFAIAPWEYVSGGLMSMMIAAIIILVTWARYRQPIYPIFIGIVMLPISFFLFPNEFLSFAILMAAIAVGVYIWWAVTRQTE